MSLVQETQADMKQCPMFPDECTNAEGVEPEVDGEHRYWECLECGYSWGYERVGDGLQIEGNCAIGVPEEVRKQASAPMEKALQDQQGSQVNLGSNIPLRKDI